MNKFIQELIGIGFEEKEAKVYLALLKLGQSGSSAIIQETELHGQFVYNSLKRLEKNGYVQVITKKGRNKYLATSPYKIINRIKEKERKAIELVDKLNSLANIKGLQEVTTYSGEEEFRNINFESTENEESGEELLIIGGQGDDFVESMGAHMRRYDNLRESKKIKVRYIGNETQREELKKMSDKRLYFSAKILPGLNTGLVNTNVFSEEVLLNIFGTPLYTIRIQNKAVTESYKNFFENIWNLSEPL